MMKLNCGELRESHIGSEVELQGWSRYRRDHGGKLFIDIADRYGTTQLVFEGDVKRIAEGIGREYVIHASGKARKRDDDTVDTTNPTGSVEIYVALLEVISASKVPPFEIIEEKKKFLANEDLRLRYRYLDLRRQEMIKRVEFRDRFMKIARKFFWENGFLELETPTLVKDTYETGSRTFLVPSRTNQGKFYSLPQSPQVYKQLCMVSGLDRYFQIARCYRDEDPREDRQPEFTQIDLELSFIDERYIKELIERFLQKLVKELTGKELKTPFRSMGYEHAMKSYGSDKPDLRFDSRIADITEDLKSTEYNIIKRVIESNGKVKAMSFRAGYGSADARLDKNYMIKSIEYAKTLGLKGLTWLYVESNAVKSEPQSIADSLGEAKKAIRRKTGAEDGDIIIVCSDTSEKVLLDAMGKLRKAIGDRIDQYNSDYEFLWVEGFPLFERDEVTGRLKPTHNPFTSPTPESIGMMDKEPERMMSRQYDLVLNGTELGSGSIRINDPELQRKALRLMGMSDESIERSFGFLLEALGYGAPVHGGIALGVDRLVALLYRSGEMRDFILFPKNKKYESPLDGSPTPIDKKRLREDFGIDQEKL